MKIKTAARLALFVFLLSACKKEDANSFTYIRLKTITDERSGFSSTYYYDASGRVTYIRSSNDAVHTFTYAGNCVNEHYTHTASNSDWTECRELNPQGYYQGSFGDDFIYNQDGYLHQILNYDSSQLTDITTFTIVAGNLTDKADSSVGGTSSHHVYYEYDNSKLNTIGNENHGMIFYGKSSTHIVSRAITVNHYGDTTAFNPDTCSFDGMNRVASKRTFNNLGGLIRHYTYTYY
ncbi:MAG: hypothetical protein V4615_04840 [Bacteroidota bacterium]